MKIWSKRFSIAQGNHWQYERDCSEQEAQAWLEILGGRPRRNSTDLIAALELTQICVILWTGTNK